MSLLGVFALQSISGIVFCGVGPSDLWSVTAVLLAPAVAMLFSANAYRTVGACLTVVPFVLWANYMDCRVDEGGTQLAYVPVALLAIPLSIVGGWLANRATGALRDAIGRGRLAKPLL